VGSEMCIRDRDQKMNDLLGKEEDAGPGTIVEFEFKDSAFTGFWVDHDEPTSDGNLVILFYVGGICYSTPCNTETLEKFRTLINE